MAVRPLACQQRPAGQRREHLVAGREAVQPGEVARRVGHLAVGPDHLDARQIVAQPGLVVVGVVRRCDLHDPSSEFRIDKVVGDHRNLAADQRDGGGTADEIRVARIIRVHGERRIAEHRLGPRCLDLQVLGLATRGDRQRITNLP